MPARRKPTLPPHDPRAIRGALRREIYELGDSLPTLDHIEFVNGEAFAQPFALRPIVNGRDIVRDISHEPLNGFNLTWSFRGLTDAEGTRAGVQYTLGPPPDFQARHAQLTISVIGRYVRWHMGPELDYERFVFDRATYRESLREAFESIRHREDWQSRVRREFFQRTPWAGPERMGLREPRLWWDRQNVYVSFWDPIWGAKVHLVVGARRAPLEENLARATLLIARWEPSEFQACGVGPTRPPYFPEHWGFVTERRTDGE